LLVFHATNIVAIQGAATNADNAATSASNASTSASNASTSASNAATSASNAATSASASEAAKDAALSALDSFDDRYLGAKATDPTLDNDGNALVSGALYYNTTDNIMKVYTGSAWVAAYASLEGAVLKVGDTMTGNLTLSNAAELIFNDSADDYNLKFNGGTVFSILSNNEDSFQWLFNDNAKMILDFETLDINTDVTINPNKKITFGVSNELEIYYNSATNEAIIAQVDDGDLVLSSNAEISLTTDVLVDGSVSITDAVNAKLSLSGPISSIDMYDTSSVNSNTRFESHSNGLFIKSLNDDGTATQYIIELNCSNGNIIFFDDTSTEGVHWNAATKRLGIGTVSADTALDVTGTITADGLTVDGGTVAGAYAVITNTEGTAKFGTDSNYARILDGSNNILAALSNAESYYYNNGVKVIKTASGGDISFYEATGTTPKFFWDASAESLGIGTSSPESRLSVLQSAVDGNALVLPMASGATDENFTSIRGKYGVGNEYCRGEVRFGVESFATGSGFLAFATGTNTATERMRIDSSGSWMVGNTVARTASQYSNQGGASWYQTDQHFEISTTSNVPALEVGKNNANDGSLIAFRKQGNVVGSIGTEGGNLTIDGSTTTGKTGIEFSGAEWYPRESGANSDGLTSLGDASNRFKDLYLSGDVITGGGGTGNTGEIQFVADSTRARIVGGYDSGGGGYIAFRTDTTGGTDLERARFNNAGNLAFTSGNGIDFSAVTGGTGTATGNVLDDYEEGTWTGTLTGSTSAPSTAITATGTYTKIGRSVTAVIAFSNKDSTGVSGNIVVTGLPFTAAAGGLGAGWNGRSNTGTGTTNGVMSFISSNNDLVLLNGLGASITWVSAGAGTYAGYSITYEV
jgi:hypothetical protein